MLTSKAASRHSPCANFQQLTAYLPKCSEPEVLLKFWLGNVLCATMACTFSTPQLPKVLRRCCAFSILTSKRALRHGGVQFLISRTIRWLRTRPKHWKNRVFRDFPTIFARLHFFSSGSFSFLIFFLLPFSSLTLPTSTFLFVHVVGSFTPELPSTIGWSNPWMKTFMDVAIPLNQASGAWQILKPIIFS